MSNLLHGFVQQDNISRASDGAPAGVQLTRDGAIVGIPWVQALCLEGRVFGAQEGSASTTITGGGTFGAAAADLDEFDYLHTIPATVAVIPVSYSVGYSTVGTVDETGLIFVFGDSGVISGGITLTPFNLRTGSNNTSSCTVVGLGADGGTVISLQGLIAHNITIGLTGAVATAQQFVPQWSVTTASFAPVLEGANSLGRQLAGFHPGNAGAGYVVSTWIELPINAVN